jgi:ribonuclease H / adenosylcobalamin/alpha-ribazole phosphatase
MARRWPERLWLVRHGQSAGNVARNAALDASLHRIAVDGRDMDVPLSPLGERQADALGRWFAEQAEEARPDVLLVSPYVRALHTAELFRDAGGMAGEKLFCRDERLREKEFGILDGLTAGGISVDYPDQAEFRRLLGKFYHRPPGGESWCDVILRLRSVLDTVSLHYADRRVMIVCHQVVVLCLRYIIEHLDEAKILEIDRSANVANCSVTEYVFDPAAEAAGGLRLVQYNSVLSVEAEGAVATAEPDPIVAARG